MEMGCPVTRSTIELHPESLIFAGLDSWVVIHITAAVAIGVSTFAIDFVLITHFDSLRYQCLPCLLCAPFSNPWWRSWLPHHSVTDYR